MPKLSQEEWDKIRGRYDVFCMECGHDAAHHRVFSMTCSHGSRYMFTDCKCKRFEFDDFGDEVFKMRKENESKRIHENMGKSHNL